MPSLMHLTTSRNHARPRYRSQTALAPARSRTMAHTNIAEMANPSFLMSEINVTTFEDRPVPDESACEPCYDH
jgi:hypothetical protein